MSKVIFIDVDGTLVDYEGNIPESAVAAIRKARQNGHRVYMCTGRSRAEVYPPIWEIGLDGLIGGNGSYVEDHEEVVFHQVLTKEQIHKVIDWLHERHLEFYVECNSGLYASERFMEDGVETMRMYSKRKHKPGAEQITVRDCFPDMIDGEKDLYRPDTNKVSYILSSYQDYLDGCRDFPELKNGTWGGKGEEALFGDFGVPEIDKAVSIQKLLDHLGASIEDTIAFGDAKVDIPMFELCSTSVCMGSGGDEAKAAADFVTTDVDDDGMYNAFVKLGLIEPIEAYEKK